MLASELPKRTHLVSQRISPDDSALDSKSYAQSNCERLMTINDWTGERAVRSCLPRSDGTSMVASVAHSLTKKKGRTSMFGSRHAALAVVCLMTWGCGEAAVEMETGSIEQELAGAAAYGRIPSGLPARLEVGLFEEHGGTWMKSSGADWDMRYRYFTKGWVNNWGWGAYDGGWGLSYMQETDSQGMIPAIQYYQLFGEAGGGESATLAKVQNSSTMASYFGDFKILMQRAKDFGKPVVVLLEADGFGFLQQQANHNPNTYAAVADTGMAELKN